ncbi:MAG: hypothetical protein KF723_23125 [Rhizobiaceae bacterium]|nr:hypothetical protein [Rhizobiaceae bacterium]
MKLKDWTVKRAFKGITVTGLDHRGKEQKIADVSAVAVKAGKVFATGPDGKKHELVVEPAAAA